MGVLLAATIPVVALLLWADGFPGGAAVRDAVFNVISALSTTGYSTFDFHDLPQAVLGLFLVLMLIGGGMGSTAGGMKMSRVYIMSRILGANFLRRMAPSRLVSTPKYTRAQGRTAIDAGVVAETTGFVLAYLGVFLVGTLVLTASAGVTLVEGAFEFASALGTVGLSIGVIGAESSALTLITVMVGMVLGRLEIFIVLIGVYSGWRLSKERLGRVLRNRSEERALAAGSAP